MRMTDRHAESGFTLIELIVAMVLGLIVLALIFGVVLDMFGASERSGFRAKAQRSAVNASEMLTSDLRAMRAPQREPRFTGSSDNLRNLILFNENPTNILVHDIVGATPTRLVFYAEVFNTSANSECITWEVLASGALQRSVRRFSAGCTAATVPLQQSLVMPKPEVARASALAAVPNPFRYRRLVQPTPANPNVSACTTPISTNLVTNLQRDQVVGIDLDLRSFVMGKVGRGDQQLMTSAAIPGRQSQEYHYAIGCVA